MKHTSITVERPYLIIEVNRRGSKSTCPGTIYARVTNKASSLRETVKLEFEDLQIINQLVKQIDPMTKRELILEKTNLQTRLNEIDEVLRLLDENPVLEKTLLGAKPTPRPRPRNEVVEKRETE